jgi:hypothetical protein
MEIDYVDIDLSRLFQKINQLERFDLFHQVEIPQEIVKSTRVAKISKEDFLNLLNDIEIEVVKYKALLNTMEIKMEAQSG